MNNNAWEDFLKALENLVPMGKPPDTRGRRKKKRPKIQEKRIDSQHYKDAKEKKEKKARKMSDKSRRINRR